jgi:hypothetical protein
MAQYWNYWNKLISNIQAIESIEDKKEKAKVAKRFVNELSSEYSKETDFFIQRILELDSDIELINVPASLMDSLKEALFCYVNGQYLSAIASTGIAAELFCVHIYQLYLTEIGLDRLQVKRRIRSFNNINQNEKIDTLHAIVGLNESVAGILHEIRKKRNNAVHPGEGYNYKSDALDSLQNLIDVLNAYSNSQKQAIEQAHE